MPLVRTTNLASQPGERLERKKETLAAVVQSKNLLLAYGPTVTVVAVEVTPPAVAVMLAVPVVTAVASPLFGEVFEMLTFELSEELHVQVVVTIPVVLSL